VVAEKQPLVFAACSDGYSYLWMINTGPSSGVINTSAQGTNAGSGRLLITKLPLTASSSDSLPIPTALHLASGSNLLQYQHNSLFIGYNSGVVSITDIETSKIVRTLRGDNHAGTDDVTITKLCSFPSSSSSSLVVAAYADHYVRFFDVKQGNMVSSFLAHEDIVSGLDVDPNGGRSFATASHDGAVRLWDTTTKTLIQQVFPSSFNSDTPSPSDSPELTPMSPPPLLEVDTGDPNTLSQSVDPFKVYRKFDESINSCLFMGSAQAFTTSTLPILATANADSTCTMFL